MIALIQSFISLDWLAAIAVGIAALASIWFGGRKSGKTAAKIEEMESYADTRKKMDEAGRMSDADAARQWLSERSKR